MSFDAACSTSHLSTLSSSATFSAHRQSSRDFNIVYQIHTQRYSRPQNVSHRVANTHTLRCINLRRTHHSSQTWSSPSSTAVTSFDIEHSLYLTVVLKNVFHQLADIQTLRCAFLRRTHHTSQEWSSPRSAKVSSFDMENNHLQTDRQHSLCNCKCITSKILPSLLLSLLLLGFSQRQPIHALRYGSCFHRPPILPNSSRQISCHAKPWKRQMFPWICDPTNQIMPDKM